MKNWSIFSTFFFCIHSTLAAPQIMDKIAVVVNHEIILESDIHTLQVSLQQNDKNSHHQLENSIELRHKILEQLIMDHIILQLGQRKKINITDEQVDQVIKNIVVQNHMTLEQLQKHLTDDATNLNTYREQIRTEMLISKVHNDEVRRRITIFPQEIDQLAQQLSTMTANSTEFKLSYILIPLPPDALRNKVTQAKKLAQCLVKKSKNGQSFNKLTVTYATNSNALKNGNIEWRKLEAFPTLFAEPLLRAKKNDIIGPIYSNIGFHILKVKDIRDKYQTITTTEVNTRHILLGTSGEMTDHQAYITLLDIADKINNGRISFSAAAKKISEDPISADQGGNLGWKSAENFDSIFQIALLHLKEGELSPPVRSPYGWHLIQLLNTRQIVRTEAMQKKRAYLLLFNRKFSEESQKWTQEQRASSYIKILDKHDQ